jgi:hypothetical protein
MMAAEIKTFRFFETGPALASARVIPPGERASFVDIPCVPFKPQEVIALALYEGRIVNLPVREFHVGVSGLAAEGPPFYRRFVMKDGRVPDSALVDVGLECRAVVENNLPVAICPKVIVRGQGGAAGMTDRWESYVMGFVFEDFKHARPRLHMPSGVEDARWQQKAGCYAKIRRITMRSDSKLDVSIGDIQIANICLNVGTTPIPVEFFKDGWVVDKLPDLFPCISMTVSAIKTTSEPRWLEIDVEALVSDNADDLEVAP